ncbi:hypothetical protein VULLAG_LOCUS11926 [Vulpes lagopus]
MPLVGSPLIHGEPLAGPAAGRPLVLQFAAAHLMHLHPCPWGCPRPERPPWAPQDPVQPEYSLQAWAQLMSPSAARSGEATQGPPADAPGAGCLQSGPLT